MHITVRGIVGNAKAVRNSDEHIAILASRRIALLYLGAYSKDTQTVNNTPIYLLFGDVPLARVWFFVSPVLDRV